MLRIFTLSSILIVIIYMLPFFTGEKQLEEISVPSISELSINEQWFADTKNVKIPVQIEGKTVKMDIDEYLVGVLAAEMPASFELEALKAQAVAARTYIYYKENLMLENKTDGKHKDAIVCDDFTHCNAYINLNEKNPWGNNFDMYFEKLNLAVSSTSSEYIAYDDQPIVAVFHAASSGNTESAVDVWGSNVPYLVEVSSEGSKDSPNYKSQVTVNLDEFKTKFLSKYSQANLETNPKEWFKNSKRSDAGGVITVNVGGISVKGTEIRSMFSLNSTNFTLDFTDDSIIFNTIGYGHGVGLSQYGANGFAKQGKNYKDILSWYYKDTKILTK